MELAKIILEYISVMIWPIITLILVYFFHDSILSLLPKSKISFTISGVSVETSLADLEKSVKESLRGQNLTADQWEWLDKLKVSGKTPYSHTYYDQLRPLRNAGLIREHPEGWLSSAKEIEITTLGRLLSDAYTKQ